VVPWVVGGLGALILAVILLCAGVFFYTTRSAGRFADRVIEDVKKMPPPPAWQPPPAPAPRELANVDEALAGLRSPEGARRAAGARWLAGQKPDPARRAEVVKALEPLHDDKDFGVRTWARAALVVWRGPG
jgi:hypothetical protein